MSDAAAAPVPAAEAAETPPLLERLGVRYFRSLSRRVTRRDEDGAVHRLTAGEREALKAIQRGAVLRASAAGALSTIVSAVAEVLVTPPEGAEENAIVFWGVVGLSTAIASVIEILYLYWDGLRAVHGLATAAGLDLFPRGDAEQALAAAMARAALELPNPPRPAIGIDPHREVSKFRLVLASLVYKLKVSVTNFVVKALVRRVLGRAVVRTWLPFVAVPVTAAWNGFVCWLILREARVRAMGSSAAEELVGDIFELETTVSEAQRESALRAVAATIVRTADLHPNHLAVLAAVRARRGAGPEPQALDDTARFLEQLRALAPEERPLVLRVLAVAAIIDGRTTGAERRLWDEARQAVGLAPDETALRALLKAFVQGESVPAERLRALA